MATHYTNEMRPMMPPVQKPDPERAARMKQLGGICIEAGGQADMSLAATLRRFDAAVALRKVIQQEQMAAARAAWQATGGAPPKPATEQTTSSLRDNDVIVSVAPNPKKEGSSTRERYEHWRVGDTIAQARARGLTRADVKWDIEHGFVIVRSAG